MAASAACDAGATARGRTCVEQRAAVLGCPDGPGWSQFNGGQCTHTVEQSYQVQVGRRRVAPFTERVRVAPFTQRVRVAPFTQRVRVAPFTQRVRVAPFTQRVRVAPFTQRVRVAPFTQRVRVAPFTERVRVAPFTERYTVHVTYTYTVRVRDRCIRWDYQNGGCRTWRYRTETRTACCRTETRTRAVYNYRTRQVYNYQTRPAYNYQTRAVYNYVTRPAYNYVTRPAYNYQTRPVYNYVTRPVYNYQTRQVYNYEPVYETRTRPVSTLHPATLRCEAGFERSGSTCTRQTPAQPSCASDAWTRSGWTCTGPRTVAPTGCTTGFTLGLRGSGAPGYNCTPQTPITDANCPTPGSRLHQSAGAWSCVTTVAPTGCPAGHTLRPAGPPDSGQICTPQTPIKDADCASGRLQQLSGAWTCVTTVAPTACPDGYTLNAPTGAGPYTCTPTTTTTTTAPPEQACSTDLETFGSEAVPPTGNWSTSCLSTQRGNARTPYYAKRYTFTLAAAARVTASVSSDQGTYVYLLSVPHPANTAPHASGTTQASTQLPVGTHQVEVARSKPRLADGNFTLTVTATIIPPAPSGLKCFQDLADNAAPYDTECSWDAVVSDPMTSRYRLQTRYQSADGTWSLPATVNLDATRVTRALALGTYQARVQAALPSEGAWSSWSEPFDVVAPTRPAAPVGDCDVSTSGLESTVTWTWTSTGPQAEYDIAYSDPSQHPAGQSLWQDAGSRTAEGPTTGLTPGSQYVIYVRAKNIVGASTHIDFTCVTPSPSGIDQYALVRKMAHLGNIAGGYTLQQFKDAKNPSDPHNPAIAPYPYLTWRDDDCSVPSWLAVPVHIITGWGNEYDPVTPGAPTAPLKEGCWRHDFAWRNLARIELTLEIDTWNLRNYRLSNDRLKADWQDICEATYSLVWVVQETDCKSKSTLAWRVLNSRGPSVDEYLDEYALRVEDVGYVQD